MCDENIDLGLNQVGRVIEQVVYIACGPVNAACNSNFSCKAKEGPVSACFLPPLCGLQKDEVRLVVRPACPPAFVEEVDITSIGDSAKPVRDLGDLYGRCYKKWGLFTSDVNAPLGAANAADITDPQEAWDDILRFRHQEMME